MTPFFTHEKLEAYGVAREFLGVARQVADGLRGEGDGRDQLMRAARSVLFNVAEGAGRRTGKEKARHFTDARGSAAECAAALDAFTVERLIAPAVAERGRALLEREVRLLSGLIRSSLSRG